jgi:hypothetical protein
VNDLDALTVQVSNDGGTAWTTVETVIGGGGGGWVRTSFLVEDFVVPTSQVRVRFNATDNPNDSVVECGLDDFRIERRDCAPLTDCNANGILDSDDIASGRSLDANANDVPDECEPGPPDPRRKVNLNPKQPGPP